MDKVEYVDLLLHQIQKATTLDRLIYIEDDINVAKGLGEIENKQDRRLLKIALESRYSYIIFKGILTEIETLLEKAEEPKLTLVQDFESKLDKNEKV